MGTRDTWGKLAEIMSCSGHEEQMMRPQWATERAQQLLRWLLATSQAGWFTFCPMERLVSLPPGVHLPFPSDCLDD